MTVLKARVGGQWVVVGGGGGGGGTTVSEVEVQAADPIGANPSAELWYDTDAPAVSISDDARWNTAWGVIATGTWNVANATNNVAANTTLGTVTPVLVAGRRYQITFFMNAISNPNTSSYFVLTSDGTGISGGLWQWVDGSYDSKTATWVIKTGDTGFAAGARVLRLSYSAAIAYFGNDVGYIMVQDIGPVAGASPIVDPTPAWNTLTLTSPWANYGGAWQVAQYRKVGDIVYLRGLIANTTNQLSTLATLPAGYRPTFDNIFMVEYAAPTLGFARLDVTTGGAINVSAFSNAGTNVPWLTLSQISFSVSS